MKKNSFFVMPVVMIIFLSSNDLQKNKHTPFPGGISRWSGTITFEERYTGITGKSERHVSASFINALPTLHRNIETTDFNFTDDKGTGSVTYHGETIIDGKKFGTTDCQGSGQTELHEVVVDETDNVYHFHVIGPACSGTSVSTLDGKTEPYGPEFTDITISDRPLVNKDLLSGTKTDVVDLGGDLGTVTRTTTWNLERSANDVELIITPQNYDNWLPEPGKNEVTVGSVMNISLKLQGRNGNPLSTKAKAFELHLLNTSQEPGITLNAPINPTVDLPDLRFMLQPNGEISDNFQSITIRCPGGCITGAVKIGSYDGGGWTTLRAVAVMEDDTRIVGQLLVTGGTTEITIPKRDPGSKIATSWLNANDNPGEMDDKEYSTGNSNDGDGLTAYEEYRGVISEKEFGPRNPNKFGRLDPNKKELGIMVKRAELPQFSEGIKLFEHASFIKVVRFFETEIPQNRILNKNALSAHSYVQYVQKLEKGTLNGDAVGENQPVTITAKIPAKSERVVIDITKIKYNYRQQVAAIAASNIRQHTNIRLPYTETEEIANTVAHELAHGVNIDHHGLPSIQPNITVPERSVDIYHIYDDRQTEITDRPLLIQGIIGIKGNDESGDTSCIMTYTSLYQWAFRVGNDGSLNYYSVPLLPKGKNLCTSTEGTGMNANDRYFGDGTYGNCLGHIKLRD